MSELTYGPLGDSTSLEAEAARILGQAFRISDENWSRFSALLGPENLRIVRREGEVLGGLGIYKMGQWFGGEAVPTWGVAAVGVDPSARGQAVGSYLMSSLLHEARAAGVPLSTLYPSTTSFYRRNGYEIAGSRVRYSMRIADIGVRERPLGVFRIDPNDFDSLRPIYADDAASNNGKLDRSEAIWQRVVASRGHGSVYGYQVGTPEDPAGYLLFSQSAAEEAKFGYDLRVRDFVALNADACRTIWALLADHGTLGNMVHWYGAAADPLQLILPQQKVHCGWRLHWMLRIVDVVGALEGRGYNPAWSGSIGLRVHDPILPENEGDWTLEVSDGAGRVTRGGQGCLELSIQGLACLYTGMHDAQTLIGLGLLTGEQKALRAASLAFGGPQPWMPDMF